MDSWGTTLGTISYFKNDLRYYVVLLIINAFSSIKRSNYRVNPSKMIFKKTWLEIKIFSEQILLTVTVYSIYVYVSCYCALCVIVCMCFASFCVNFLNIFVLQQSIIGITANLTEMPRWGTLGCSTFFSSNKHNLLSKFWFVELILSNIPPAS
jgi:hypothetical protein